MAKGKKTGGRRKGTQNKVTKALKDMVLSAFYAAGGETYLVEQSAKNPTAFMTLVGKILPTNVGVSGSLNTVSKVIHEHRHS